ncbi:T9SS type B sorting domain-containing protein [Flavivirga algicola]|uniref:T9SS type B sorting domain-containing protein n=1 Tax=Flavivirga algicola TaxID=2729136 RepID=A0ABX1RTJ3_9FLAO|nr:T9SS type B sorting domain-containing protein [Flavivirga algicola]NMH86481.1 T9SS type B sorting domain-containing protein [Flavivirga algicola]
MKKIALFIILNLISFNLSAQREASNWFFGFGSGIKFNQQLGIVEPEIGSVNTFEGCSAISDNDGNLLFSTDGTYVYSRNNAVMPNGFGLLGNPSSSQSAIIVPKPKDPNIYYIFTVSTHFTGIEGSVNEGLNYSEVDMRLNNGLGDVTTKNVNLLRYSSEKVSAVLKDCKTEAIWVVTLGTNSRRGGMTNGDYNTFHAFEVTDQGVDPNGAIRSVFLKEDLILDPRGYLKISPDGSKIAVANVSNGLYLYNFDKETGIVTDEALVGIHSDNRAPYGIEFSPNSKFLYASTYNNATDNIDLPETHSSSLIQFDVTFPSIVVSETQVLLDERQLYRGALQLGPDGRIYRALSETYNLGLPHLGVINFPNRKGKASDYRHNAIALSANSTQGLPPFIQSFFSEQIDIIQNGQSSTNLALCGNETYFLKGTNIPGASYTWTHDGVILPDNDFDLEVNDTGHYQLLIEPNNGECDIEGEAFVARFARPIANTPSNQNICDSNNDGSHVFDFTLMDSEIMGTQDPNIYRTHYYPTQEDAVNNTNEIFGLYSNISNPQEIFVRLSVDRNSDCYDMTSFVVEVFNTPTAFPVSPLEICDMEIASDLNVLNGQTEINLHQFDDGILGAQDPLAYSISYYKSINDAETKNAPLNFSYYNETAFSETIYARIENNLNIDCFDITPPINITINPLPEFANTALIQCDEDGIADGITVFNLNEAREVLTQNISNRSAKFYTDSARSNEINGDRFINTSNPQTIYVDIIDDQTLCVSYAELSLEVSSTQTDDYALPAVCDEIGSEDGINTFNLDDITTNIQSLNGITFPIFYYETYEDALLEQNELSSPYSNTTPYSQTIYARVENNNACYGISEVSLTINELPNVDTEGADYYCLNRSPDTITLDAAVLNDVPSNYTYNWSTGDNTYEVEINQPGVYTVEITNVNGCSKQRIITVEASNTATFNSIDVVDASSNNIVTVMVSGEGTYQYGLYDENNLEIYRDFQDSHIFENVFPGIYTVQVKDIKNDCGTVNAPVSVIGFPKFFTPNNDGFHDTWQVYGVTGLFRNGTQISIFDRFGKLLKQLNPLGHGWDGTFNGEELPTDDYWFVVTLHDGRIFKNHFTLKR